MKNFSPKKWADQEIFSQMDLYGNTRIEAIDFLLDMLSEGQYNDELTDDQVVVARQELVNIYTRINK